MSSFRRKRWYLMVPLVIASTSGVAVVTAARPYRETECQVSEAWVAKHLTSLPANLSEFDQLSMSLRRHAYFRLTPQAREAIWREKLQRYTLQASGLTEAQRNFISRAIENLPTLVDDSTGTTGRKFMTETGFHAEMSKLFSKEQRRDIFFTLGTTPATKQGVARNEDCDCNWEWGDNEYCDPFTCEQLPPSDPCNEVLPTGCGDLGDVPCDGWCF